METLSLKDFNILGIITLQDVEGIEKYVTPIIKDRKKIGYLSRSKEYYNVKTMTELALEREELKQRLTTELSKRNFVILENMINCSAKVYFKKFEEYIKSGKSEIDAEELERAKQCLDEDMKNILNIFENRPVVRPNPVNVLPTGDENSEKRSIEMDNKAVLYIFAKSLKRMRKQPDDIEILTPGYGSIYIGPMLKSMYGYDYTTLLRSNYIEESMNLPDINITELMSSDRVSSGTKSVMLLDDNIGTGFTMSDIKEKLKAENIEVFSSGAVQYNWRNYYRISTGQKKDIDRFDPNNFDFLTPLNYAGHKLYKHAIDLLHSSGEEYVSYLQSKSYRREDMCDLTGSINRGIECSRKSGLELYEDYKIPRSETFDINEILEEYRHGPKTITNPISRMIIERIIQEVRNVEYGETPQEIKTMKNDEEK